MFVKPFKVKSNNQIKGTERKKLIEDVLTAFPKLSEENVQNLLPKKEAITIMKVTTHNGQLTKLFCVARIPMFFQLDQPTDGLFPSVYTLWHHPDLLYAFTTKMGVVSKLSNGADLMLPGVILDGPATLWSFGKLQKGTHVCVNTDDNKAPVAVGVTARSSEDLYMSAGRGKCVEIYHVLGDALCQLGKPPLRPELGIPAFLDKTSTDSNPAANASDATITAIANSTSESLPVSMSNLEMRDTAVVPGDSEVETEVEVTAETVEGLIVSEESESTGARESTVPSDPVREMDKLLEYCFLKACKTSIKKTDLPLLSSNFFKNHLLAACPPGQTLDVKKSSYKKLSVFLANMKAKGVIDTSITKGVESLLSIKFDHPLVKRLVVMEEPSPVQPVVSNAPVVSECYKVTADVLPILSKYGYEKGDVLKRTEVRQCFLEYVKKEGLQDGKTLNLNPQLAGIYRTKADVIALSIEDGINKFIGRMTHTHAITASGTQLLYTGKLEPIDITVTSRSNNKKVTLVNNLETFGIKLEEFSKECQGIGASATITDVPGKKTPSVLVQGNQVLYVHKLLTEKYQINKKYIRGLEFAPKKKK